MQKHLSAEKLCPARAAVFTLAGRVDGGGGGGRHDSEWMAHLNSTATPFACAPELPEKVEPSISNTAIAPPRYATFSKTKTTHESASAAVPSPEAAQEQKRARARERERSA